MRCARCGEDAVVSIQVRIAGEDVVFRRCGSCEVNAWEAGAGSISLDEVLERVRTDS